MSREYMLLLAIVLGIIVLAMMASLMLRQEARARDMNVRVDRAIYGDTQSQPFFGLLNWLQRFGEYTRRFYTQNNLEDLRVIMTAAGFNPHRMLPTLLGAKAAMMVLVPVATIVAGVFVPSPYIRIFMVCAGVVVGIIVPELILGYLRRRFAADTQRGTPDALDLLVVCSEAGMALESAIERVAEDMQKSNPSMATIFAGLHNDLIVLPNRSDAFTNLAKYNVSGLRRLGVMLAQSAQYGTPVSNALRAVAEELRRERMNLLEERAVKLPAKLIFPLILCIFPCLWIITLGSSLLRLSDSIKMLVNNLPG